MCDRREKVLFVPYGECGAQHPLYEPYIFMLDAAQREWLSVGAQVPVCGEYLIRAWMATSYEDTSEVAINIRDKHKELEQLRANFVLIPPDEGGLGLQAIDEHSTGQVYTSPSFSFFAWDVLHRISQHTETFRPNLY